MHGFPLPEKTDRAWFQNQKQSASARVSRGGRIGLLATAIIISVGFLVTPLIGIEVRASFERDGRTLADS